MKLTTKLAAKYKLHIRKKFGYKLSDIETQIYIKIRHALREEGKIRVSMKGETYFESKDFSMSLSNGVVTMFFDNRSVVYNCNLQFYEKLNKLIYDKIEKDCNLMRETLNNLIIKSF